MAINTVNNIIHNELVNNGWHTSNRANISIPITNTYIKFIYKKQKFNSLPFAEFIIEYISKNEIAITVPIPFRESCLSYRNIFSIEDVDSIQDYIKIHLSNNINNDN